MADDYSRITRPHTDTPHTIDHPTQAQPWGTNNFEAGNENQRSGRTSPDLGIFKEDTTSETPTQSSVSNETPSNTSS